MSRYDRTRLKSRIRLPTPAVAGDGYYDARRDLRASTHVPRVSGASRALCGDDLDDISVDIERGGALTLVIIGLYKTEVIHWRGPWKGIHEV